MSVYKKLQEARVRFHKLSLKKSGENKFAGYKYFELGDFLPVVQEIFGELGLCGAIQFFDDRAQLKIVDVDKPEDAVYFVSPSAEVQLKGCLPIQGIGAAQTYLRRYLWVAAMEIVEHDVLDATTGKDDTKKAVIKEKMSAADIAKWQKKIDQSVDKVDAGKSYTQAIKACDALGDLDAAAAIKKYATERWA